MHNFLFVWNSLDFLNSFRIIYDSYASNWFKMTQNTPYRVTNNCNTRQSLYFIRNFLWIVTFLRKCLLATTKIRNNFSGKKHVQRLLTSTVTVCEWLVVQYWVHIYKPWECECVNLFQRTFNAHCLKNVG